jgi:hypothetical protein
MDTSLCPNELAIARDCIAVTNPACADCMDSVQDAIFTYTDTVSCDDYEQQICNGYETCACQTCEVPLSNLYTCIQGYSCPTLDCTSTSGTYYPTDAPSPAAITITASPTSNPIALTNAPITYTQYPTTGIDSSNDSCESLLNEVSDCIANNNAECLDCLLDVENSITTTVTCDYYQQQICTGINTCGCEACQMQLEAVYSCVHAST